MKAIRMGVYKPSNHSLRKRPFTAAEDEFLKKHQDKPLQWVCKELRRGNNAIQRRKLQLGLQMKTRKRVVPYTPEEDSYIIANRRKGATWIAAKLKGRTPKGIYHRLSRLDALTTHVKPYTNKEIEVVKANAGVHPSYVATLLGRSTDSVRAKMRHLGIKPVHKLEKREFSQVEEDFLRNNHDKPHRWLAQELGRSASSIGHKLRRMKNESARDSESVEGECDNRSQERRTSSGCNETETCQSSRDCEAGVRESV